LIFIDRKVLSKKGDVIDFRTNLAQIIQMPFEKLFVCKYADSGGLVLGVIDGYLDRVKILPDRAFTGRMLFDFRDDIYIVFGAGGIGRSRARLLRSASGTIRFLWATNSFL